jgi:hypothetical protein
MTGDKVWVPGPKKGMAMSEDLNDAVSKALFGNALTDVANALGMTSGDDVAAVVTLLE